MKKSPIVNNILLIFVGLFLFIIDRIMKALSINNFFDNNLIGINNILFLDFYKNTNIAFSIPIGNNMALIFSISFLFVLCFLFFVFFRYRNNRSTNIFSIVLIFCGALSNIIDRIKYNYVVDYINLLNINILNLSDIMIVLGFIIFALNELIWCQKSK